MKELNATQQAIIMSFFDPFVDVIVDRVSERILSVTTKKNLSFIPVKKLRIYFMLLYLHWQG
jgi:hypothetical protein